ncbi:MAG: potassium transporter Kef [Gammaproteobacteria bacterium]|nr:potassium transporter Kef [Gammaproteobacteria bacterium]
MGEHLDIIWLIAAFVLGLGAHVVGLPPLVGYLCAGVALKLAGYAPTTLFHTLAEFGVILLLFSIGLRLRPSSLLRPQVWGVSGLHMVLTLICSGAIFTLFCITGLPMFATLEPGTMALIGFALSLSSTVFAVQIFQARDEQGARYGQIAVGILIIQDLMAVLVMAGTIGKPPPLWALGFLLLIPARKWIRRGLDRIGHDELLVLFGVAFALGGGELFETAGLRGDLGALLLGMLMAGHARAHELSQSLLGFRNLFLIAFFVSIGLQVTPGWDILLAACLLLPVLLLKTVLMFLIMLLFRLRARTAALGAVSLATYSEFALILGAFTVQRGWLSADWLAVITLAVALSFIVAVPFNVYAHRLYVRYGAFLARFQSPQLTAEERPIEPGRVDVLIFGMGHIGIGAYDALGKRGDLAMLGVDIDRDAVQRLVGEGYRVIRASATDPEFWERFQIAHQEIRYILLTMPVIDSQLFVARHLRRMGHKGRLVAIARYPEDADALRQAGVDHVLEPAGLLGAGLADYVLSEPLEWPGVPLQ